MNKDFLDLIAALLKHRVRFLVVGAHALAVHGIPRATGDLDLWIGAERENASRVLAALTEFGAPLASLKVKPDDLSTAGRVVQIGVPPRRIDLLTTLTGVEFEEAWSLRRIEVVEGLEVPFLDKATLIRNKRATGRTKDLADLEALEGSD